MSTLAFLILTSLTGSAPLSIGASPQDSAPPATAPATVPATKPASAPASTLTAITDSHATPGEDDPMAAFRAPLLREGTMLVEAISHMKRDSGHNWWVLVVQPVDASAPPYELVMLPCTRLAEMERILEAMPGGNADFQVTGRVHVFRDRNYLLASHAAVVGTSAAATMAAAQHTPESQPTTAASPATRPAAVDDDSAEAIARSLQQQTDRLARSSGIARGPATRNATTTTSPGGGVAAIAENTAIVNRRGKITRDRSGGWLLVLDADASGLSDPPLRLMPCALMESIEDYARRTGNNSPVIITGQVYAYNGQNFLLPTVYRIPRERSRITP